MSPSRKYDRFDEEVARRVIELHEKHPNLGHNGLLDALKDDGIEVDPQELEEFMAARDIEGEKWVHIPNSIRRHFRISRMVFPDEDVIELGDDK